MTTQVQALTGGWLDIKTSLSLTETNDYLLQNTGAVIIELREDASTPSATDQGHPITSRSTWAVTIGPQGLYVRSSADVGEIIVTQAQG